MKFRDLCECKRPLKAIGGTKCFNCDKEVGRLTRKERRLKKRTNKKQ